MNQTPKKMLTRTVATLCCAWIAFAVQAVGLSTIKVQSGLGQPLLAQIEVSALEPDEFARVNARIAGPDEYAAAKLAYSPLLRQVRIAAEHSKEGKSILNITSVAPVNEPTLELLVDFNWRGGRLLQKYSVLLDPVK
jgi:pilus assembly protein FimV